MKNRKSAFGSKSFLLSPTSRSRGNAGKASSKWISVYEIYGTAVVGFLFGMTLFTFTTLVDFGMPRVLGIILALAMIALMIFANAAFIVLFFIASTITSIMSWATHGFLNLYSLLFITAVVSFIVLLALSRKYDND